MKYEDLIKPLPSEAITPHPTKTYLSSIKAIYVTERFTEVFGVGKWTTKVKVENVNHDTGMVIVHVTFEVPEHNIYYESFGGNDNGGKVKKGFDLGDAYKGATTDALTKIGSYLGVGIEVYKGKGKAASKPTKVKDDGKVWLNKGTEDWTNAVAFLQTPDGTLLRLKNRYKISKENEEQLLNQSL